jgi:hypothetical protein
VTCDNIAVAIDQDRDIEAESLDAVANLADLLFAMTPRIGGVRFELIDPPVDDFERPGPPDCHRLNAVVLCRFHTMLLRCA